MIGNNFQDILIRKYIYRFSLVAVFKVASFWHVAGGEIAGILLTALKK